MRNIQLRNMFPVLNTILNHSRDALLVIDEQGIIYERNTFAEKWLPTETIHKLNDFVHETDMFLSVVNRAHGEHAPLTLESLHWKDRENTNRISLTFRISRLPPLAENSPNFYLVTVSKQTEELENLEEAARKNEERVENLSKQLDYVSRQLVDKTLQVAEQKNKLDAIINGMGDGLVAGDEQGRIIQYNTTAQALLTFPIEDVHGKSFSELCPEIAEAIQLNPHHPATLTKQEVNVSYHNKELRICATPIFDQENHHFGFVLILQDRTKQAEIDRMKSDLISIVSHELRSPLTSIKGYLDLMLTGDLGEIPDSIREYLSIVTSNAGRLSALIDDMLDLSRIESGKLSMSFEKVDLKYLCDYMYVTIKPQADQKKQSLTLEVEPNITVSGDVDRLQQALTNLVSNAIKYTPEEGTVEVKAGRRNKKAFISVRDNGIGISQDNQKKLFQKFFRVKNKETRNIGGTGLGLCIAESIVKAHEGTILVQSVEGEGSIFEIELPRFDM